MFLFYSAGLLKQKMSPYVAHRYSLEEVKQIDLSSPDLKVSPQVMDILKLIETQIVIPQEEVISRIPAADRSRPSVRRKPPTGGSSSSCSAGRSAAPFQATKRVEVSSLDKQFNEIRAMMNKLSTKNVEAQKPVVIDAIAKMLFQIEDETAVKIQHVRKITEILISNPFLVKVYVEIYAELCSAEFPYRDDFIAMVQDQLVPEYVVSLRELQAITSSEEEDYDAFCEYNKRNDKRKAWATFFAEASKQTVVVTYSRIQEVIQELLDLVHQNLVKENKTSEVEEWTENIAVLVNNSGLSTAGIHSSMNDLTQKKPKDFPSWSSRALFKYMDLVK